MNNDLISRKALKNYARKVMYEKNATNFSLLKVFDEIIDNAPTVDAKFATTERPQVNVIPKECIKVLAETITDVVQQIDWKALCEKVAERPQGEWVIDGHHYKCSRCGKTLAIMFSETDDDDLIGCPFCLADMRKGDAEE